MENQRTEIATLGEFGLIEHLTQDTEIYNASTLLGIGDDAAVIDPFNNQVVVSTDMLIEGVHFDMAYTPLKHLGYKSVIVNISDIYAMNATPTQITVSIGVSNRYSVEALSDLYDGIQLACAKYGVDLVGGDTTSSRSGLIISITAIGMVNENKFVTRSGAQVHDLICVTGNLGAAYTGLLLLEREKKIYMENPEVQPDFENQTYIVERFLKPEAQNNMIAWFAQKNILPTAMIDISDGLSSELLHICKQSNTGATLYEEKIPIHEQTRQNAERFKIAALTCALNGGEDYELLFTIPTTHFEAISACTHCTIIGHIDPVEKGCHIITTGNHKIALQAQGWSHLKK